MHLDIIYSAKNISFNLISFLYTTFSCVLQLEPTIIYHFLYFVRCVDTPAATLTTTLTQLYSPSIAIIKAAKNVFLV